jgi:hypothetical protein
MKKLGRKLRLQRETLRWLESGADLRRAQGAFPPSAINCPTASACSNLCKPSNVISECDTDCCGLG